MKSEKEKPKKKKKKKKKKKTQKHQVFNDGAAVATRGAESNAAVARPARPL
jgi:hypothetical protein